MDLLGQPNSEDQEKAGRRAGMWVVFKKWDSPLIMITITVTGQEPQDKVQHPTQCADQ